VITDARADRLRFGFGLYHVEADVDRVVERLAQRS
jgi:selenocysteine lyase/cysteine desulfurase